ncbi:MAG: hypothetical protein R2712_06210 [Vicinamibacterales bacterium]
MSRRSPAQMEQGTLSYWDTIDRMGACRRPSSSPNREETPESSYQFQQAASGARRRSWA